jgi:hypothetical protein
MLGKANRHTNNGYRSHPLPNNMFAQYFQQIISAQCCGSRSGTGSVRILTFLVGSGRLGTDSVPYLIAGSGSGSVYELTYFYPFLC